ncbi:MAG TPA: ABC transporter substrate-binding protein, partial [Longimicrobiales bacterium]|nr:ABC transporter substrate-binding protein [Longimicrobiales bacterium]
RALAQAIDREEITEGLRRGYGEVAVGPIMPLHWSFDPDLPPLPYAPDSAAALLVRAGFQDTDGDGMLNHPDGAPFTIDLKYPAASDFNRDVAEAVRGDLARVGVEVRPRPTETSTLFADVTSPDRNFDAALLGWSGDFRLDFRDVFHSDNLDGPYQFASYGNPAVDSLLDRATLEADRARATPLWRRLQEILREEQPWSPLYYQTDAFLIRERVGNVRMDIRGALVNVTDWWVDAPAPADSIQAPGVDADAGDDQVG